MEIEYHDKKFDYYGIKKVSYLTFKQYYTLPENLKEENGPLSKLLRSYNFTLSELIPTAKMRPSGSKAATGLPARLINPWQYEDLKY